MPSEIDKILTDLPTIQRIALRPQAENPLLAVILTQAQALAEIGAWAGNAHKLAADAADAAAEAVPEAPGANGSLVELARQKGGSP